MNFSLCARNSSNSNGTQDNHFGLMIRTFANGYYRHPATFCENDLPHAQTPYQVSTCVVRSSSSGRGRRLWAPLVSNSGQRRLTWGSHCHPRYLRVWLAGLLVTTLTHTESGLLCVPRDILISPVFGYRPNSTWFCFRPFLSAASFIHSFIQPW